MLKLYYNSFVWYHHTEWLGVPTLKNPLDLWAYQQIIHQCKPDLIIETGSYKGGSALYLAHILDLLQQGQIISIDVETHDREVRHNRIDFWQGSSTSPTILERLKEQISSTTKVMVILDSDHREDHVLKELELYHGLVSKGQYLICEDSNINGHPV